MVFLPSSLQAQEVDPPLAHHALYAEFLGQGELYSINYDHRLGRHWSFRAGFTQWTLPSIFIFMDGEIGFAVFPLMVNYLIGGKDAYFEIGVGAVPVRPRMTEELFFSEWLSMERRQRFWGP